MGYLTDCLLRCPTIEAFCTLVPGGDDAGRGTYDNSIMGQRDKFRHLLIAGEQLFLLSKQLITLNKSSNQICGCSCHRCCSCSGERPTTASGRIILLSGSMIEIDKRWQPRKWLVNCAMRLAISCAAKLFCPWVSSSVPSLFSNPCPIICVIASNASRASCVRSSRFRSSVTSRDTTTAPLI